MLGTRELAVLLERAKNRDEALHAVAEHFAGAEIPDIVAPYVLSLSLENMTAETSETHLKLLRCVSSRVQQASLPGLFSAYFRVLRRRATCSVLVRNTECAVCTVLENVSVLDSYSQSRIFDFLYFYTPSPAFVGALTQLKRLLAPSMRVLVLRKLLLVGAPLADDEYDTLNDSVEENATEMTLAVVAKLLERERLVFRTSLVDVLAGIEGSEDTIRALQERFLAEVPRPLIHLCPVSEQSMAQCHRADFSSMEMYFENYMRARSSVPVTAHVLLRYLKHPALGSTYFARAADLRHVNYSAVLDHVRRDIADVLSLRNLVAHAYCRQVCSLLPDLVDAVHLRGDSRMEYLEIIYLLVQRSDLDREELRLVFDELLYLDGGMHVRAFVLRILGVVVVQFAELDEAVRASAAAASGRESPADMVQSSCNERISREDTGTLSTNNANVLAAKLWPEIVAFRDAGMLRAVLSVLLDIVRGTKLFYSSRMQSSGCLSDVVRCCRAGGRTQSMCMELVALAAEHFQLSKRCFEEVFCAVELLSSMPGAVRVAERLAVQDRFFFFYLATRSGRRLSAHARHALLHLEDGDSPESPAGAVCQ